MSNINSRILNLTTISDHEDLFICPICSGAMKLLHLKSLVCENNHCFDLSKQGYLNLYPSTSKVKYDKRMFDARRLISTSGFFDPLSSKISEIIIDHTMPGNNSEDELKQAVEDYIYYYNYKRFQKRLNHLAPIEYRCQMVA